MTEALAAALDRIEPEVSRRLARLGFDREWFLRMAERLETTGLDNRVRGAVSPLRPDDLVDLPARGTPEHARLEAAGFDALAGGRCALVVLAGGMATRMGGVVKALVEALPGRTFLDLRLGEQRAREARAGAEIPLWLMTSHATHDAIREALGGRVDGYRLAVFRQGISLRLTPERELFLDEEGRPSEHAPGHGDLPDALKTSGLLERFVERGGEVVTIANLDNLGASLDPVVIGLHLERGRPLSCEVVDKVGSDRGGVPVLLDGQAVILEEFRLPRSFDPAGVRVFNTNTFHVDAGAMAALDIDWPYFAVEKEVDGRPAIQFERLVNELTHHLESNYVRVPRTGADSHYLPAKDDDELVARRADLEQVARSRGMIT